MSTDERVDDVISGVLRDAHNEIQPPDSWEALRTRIDQRVFGHGTPSVFIRRQDRNTVFWRRMALALAACLAIVSAMLAYALFNAKGVREQNESANEYLLRRDELTELSMAFSHVRQLFGEHSPWMVVESGGKGEIGVDNGANEAADANKLIIVRLAVHVEGRDFKRRYYDVVTFSGQHVSFSTSIAEGPAMKISLKPLIASNGGITVEINARVNNGSQAGQTVTIAKDSFTSLVRLRANGRWININAVGQPACNI
ncbi:MAG: hypothetical protein A2Z25_01015 [Planctomycetes bacterium RBG_16_55_9]|nr:MAG: hypothetical protein A2Z25_01015 [Planctomycetes bacterium RBG_16_55_9]